MAPHESTLVLEYADEERARTVARSLRREVGEIAGDRSTASVSRDGRTVTVRVAADDRTALRAGGNTWLSLAAVAERAMDAGDRYAGSSQGHSRE
jgi:KEOPS complex subunit Pcc1